jgi:hypothetical protein
LLWRITDIVQVDSRAERRVRADAMHTRFHLLLCLLGLLLVSSFSPASAQETPKFQPTASVTPESLLIQSYIASQQLVPEERSMALMYLAMSAASIQPAYNRLWSEELFYSAFQLPRTWNRVAYEKNALAALSDTDPPRAFQLFGLMDNPIPMDSGALPEDVRAFGASRVFSAYWKVKGHEALDEIRAQAEHLGETGEYPYTAMTPIILDLAHSSPNEAEIVFNEAVTYFSRGSRVVAANRDFVEMLNALWNSLSAPVKHEGLDVAVSQLSQPPPSNGDESVRGKAQTKSQSVEFTDRNRQLLFELIPRIREVDPAWAKRLVDSSPSLAAAMESGGIQRSETLSIQNVSSASPNQITAAESLLMQERTFAEVKEQAAQDPDAALVLSGSLTNPGFRAAALAQVAASLAVKDPKKAQKLLDQSKDIVSGLKDTPAKVAALCAVAEAYYAFKDEKGLQSAWSDALSLGEELIEEDLQVHPGKATYQSQCFEMLADLMRFGGRIDPQMAVQGLHGLQNQQLLVYLPIFTANGIVEGQQTRLSTETQRH